MYEFLANPTKEKTMRSSSFVLTGIAIFLGCAEQTSPKMHTQMDRAKTGSARHAEDTVQEEQEEAVSPIETGAIDVVGESPGGEREQLIARLVRSGDEAMSQDKNLACRYYSFASLYAPSNDKIKAKLAEAEAGAEFRLPDSQGHTHFLSFWQTISSDAFGKWPKATAEMEIADLRVLLDPRLVGTLDCRGMTDMSTGETAGEAVRVFLSVPDMERRTVLSEYGKPATDVRIDNGWSVLTYANVRIVADDSADVRYVVCRQH